MNFFQKKNVNVASPTSKLDTMTLDERKAYSKKLLDKYPECVPVIIKKRNGDKNLQDINLRYIIPKHLDVSYLLTTIRQKIKMTECQAIFIFAKNTLVPMNTSIGDIYNEHRGEDNILYIVYATENTFG
jgi:hypothetical protein